MTTIKDMVADAKRQTYGSLTDQINLIAAVALGGATTIVMELDVSGITAGMSLSSGLNVWYVKGIDVSSKSVYVIPGYDNAPQDAVAIGDFVYIKPRVTDWFLFTVMNQQINQLSSSSNGLYRISSWTAEVDPVWQTYAIPTADAAAFGGMLRVRWLVPGSTDLWLDVPSRFYRVQINDGTSYVRILSGVPSGTDLEFTYKGAFTQAVALTDDPVAFCGLSASMVDIPSLGCVVALLHTTDSRRNQVQSQGDARRAGEVSGTANSQIASQLNRLYRERVQEEYARLVSRISILRGT